MCQDGSTIQDKKTKRKETMDKGRSGIMREIYTLGDGRMATELKERYTNCSRMALTHSTMSSMMKTKKR